MSFIGLGVAIGNVAGAVAASVGTGLSALGATGLGAALGGSTAAGTAVGAGGLGSLLGATAAGTAGSALAGTSLAPAASTTALGNLAAAGAGGASSAPVVGAGGFGGSSFLNQAALAGLGATPETSVPVGSTVSSLASGVGGGAAGEAGLGSLAGAVPVGTVSNVAAGAASPTTLTSGGMTGYGKLGDSAVSNVVTKIPQEVSQQIANKQTEAGSRQVEAGQTAEEQQATQDVNRINSPQGWRPMGKAEGGIATIRAARGGSVPLRNGDYIVPADVVSALGNGSSKAGARYLTHLCNALNAGPPPKAGSLAKQRAKARHTA